MIALLLTLFSPIGGNLISILCSLLAKSDEMQRVTSLSFYAVHVSKLWHTAESDMQRTVSAISCVEQKATLNLYIFPFKLS